MILDLERTFSEPNNARSTDEGIYDDASLWLERNNVSISWDRLHQEVLTVVVGEAGIGKTYEFKNEVKRLKARGEYAFFIELNQLSDKDSWPLALQNDETKYDEWVRSNQKGFFFLDAVDEARLVSHSALKKSLLIVMKELGQNLEWVQIYLSSRWTDWTMSEVQALVDELLLKPIIKARVKPQPTKNNEISGNVLKIEKTGYENSNENDKTLVVSLNPLSLEEAKRFSSELGTPNNDAFWVAVNDEDYLHMATRPLDLQWMVGLWKQNGKLGTYLELLHSNIINGLVEANPNYKTSSVVLSPSQLRVGAEVLAASSTFSGRFYISLGQEDVKKTEIIPEQLLPDWNEVELQRLLSSAIFDEATYNRIKFHHRSSREYLAACWVDRQLQNGLPLHYAISLFASSPFGDLVLIPARRWTLCWLATINIEIQEWVTRHFPEMIIFDGDPEAWSDMYANQAFSAYLKRVSQGLWLDWINSAGEYRRVARKVSENYIISILLDTKLPVRVKLDLLPFISHGQLTNCADPLFQLYKSYDAGSRERVYALQALKSIATANQLEEIKAELLAGTINKNNLIATALGVIGVENFTVEELSSILEIMEDDSDNALHPMVQFLEHELLPGCDLHSAAIILGAIVQSYPDLSDCKNIAKYPESSRPKKAWMLEVLPNCFERYLSLLSRDATDFPEACFRAAEEVESLWNTSFVDPDLYQKIGKLVGKFEVLRWDLAQRFASSDKISHVISRLTWGRHSLVFFNKDDLDELIRHANDMSLHADSRNIWFSIALHIAMSDLKELPQKEVLTSLLYQDVGMREAAISSEKTKYLNNQCQSQEYYIKERKRKRDRQVEHQERVNKLFDQIEDIRTGAAREPIISLINYSYSNDKGRDLYHVNLDLIAKAYGDKLALALSEGLRSSWQIIDPPDPNNYKNGNIPWDAIVLLNSANIMLEGNSGFDKLTAAEVMKVASVAVWETDAPPKWFERLVRFNEELVCLALHPWIIEETLVEDDTWQIRRSTSIALNSPKDVRSVLLKPTVGLIKEDKVKNSDTLRQLSNHLYRDGLLTSEEFTEICREQLRSAKKTDGVIEDLSWLRTWLEIDLKGAWIWFCEQLEVAGKNKELSLKKFAEVWGQIDLMKGDVDPGTVDVMIEIFRETSDIISTNYPKKTGLTDNFPFFNSLPDLRDSIPRLLEKIPGAAVNMALAGLVGDYPESKDWLRARQLMQASMVAQTSVLSDPEKIISSHAIFTDTPGTEAQLYHQVLGRLEEIRIGLEEGPFSERVLMKAGLDESCLQIWLAAHLEETQNRRFGVHREEEVDMKNRTDIQVSCNTMKVCIEIKLVDRSRSYSARSLTETLTDQIVGKYLKGYNSTHGILVLFRLDDKTWIIPGEGRNRSFSDLVQYLKKQAQFIAEKSDGVKDLTVLGFDCYTNV